MAVEKTVVIVVEGDEAIREVEKLNDQLDQTNKEIDDINSNSGQGFDNAAKGADKFKTAIRGVGVALKAAGIGLALAAIAKIADLFQNSPKGAQIISQALNTVNLAMYALWENASNFAAVMEAILKGQFGVAAGLASLAWKQLATDMSNAVETGGKIAQMEEDLRRLQNSNLGFIESQSRIIAEQRFTLEDAAATLRERLAAVDEVEKASLRIVNAKTKEIQLEKDILEAQGLNTISQKERYAQLEAELIAAGTQRIELLKDINNQYNAIVASNQETEIEVTKEGYDQQLDALTGFNDDVIAEELRKQNRINEINKKAAKENEDTAEAEKNARVNALQATGDALVKLSIIAGQESAKGKALAVAAVLVSAAVATIKTWEGYAEFGPWGTAGAIAQTVTIAAATLAAISQITNADSGARSMVGGGSSATPAPSYNVVGASQTSSLEQQLATEGIRVSSDTPLKSYVVASDVTTQAALDRQIEANAGF